MPTIFREMPFDVWAADTPSEPAASPLKKYKGKLSQLKNNMIQEYDDKYFQTLKSEIESSPDFKALFSYSLSTDVLVNFVFLYCMMSAHEIPGARLGLRHTKDALKQFFNAISTTTGLDALPVGNTETDMSSPNFDENQDPEDFESPTTEEEQIKC